MSGIPHGAGDARQRRDILELRQRPVVTDLLPQLVIGVDARGNTHPTWAVTGTSWMSSIVTSGIEPSHVQHDIRLDAAGNSGDAGPWNVAALTSDGAVSTATPRARMCSSVSVALTAANSAATQRSASAR
jgi:hypothetical protein